MTAGRSSENGRRFAGGHFAGGHDGMANLCKPITAYDFHARYNNNICFMYHTLHYIDCITLPHLVDVFHVARFHRITAAGDVIGVHGQSHQTQ